MRGDYVEVSLIDHQLETHSPTRRVIGSRVCVVTMPCSYFERRYEVKCPRKQNVDVSRRDDALCCTSTESAPLRFSEAINRATGGFETHLGVCVAKTPAHPPSWAHRRAFVSRGPQDPSCTKRKGARPCHRRPLPRAAPGPRNLQSPSAQRPCDDKICTRTRTSQTLTDNS